HIDYYTPHILAALSFHCDYPSLLFYLLLAQPPPISTLFPYTTLFRSHGAQEPGPVSATPWMPRSCWQCSTRFSPRNASSTASSRSEEHTSELQSRGHLVCRLLLEKKKKYGRSSPSYARLSWRARVGAI